jgi:hypothetical protein
MMKIAVIKSSREHEHFYRFNAETKKWEFLICELEGSWTCCTGNRGSLPKGTKFDVHRDAKSFYDRYPEL